MSDLQNTANNILFLARAALRTFASGFAYKSQSILPIALNIIHRTVAPARTTMCPALPLLSVQAMLSYL
jgi:hypothetical protein